MKPKQPQMSGPQPEAVPKRRKAAVRTACLGLTGAALQACMAAPQPVPPERPAPPPQACPPGAVETMTGMLGFRLGELSVVQWSDVRGRPVPVGSTLDTTNPFPDPGEEYAQVYGQLYGVNPPPASGSASTA